MKIGLVCPYSFNVPGGVQNHVLGLARWLREHKHQVQVFGPGQHHEIISVGYGFPVRFNGSVSRIALNPMAIWRLRRYVCDLDLLHVHEPLVPLLGPSSLGSGIPVVATYHANTSAWVHQLLRPFAQINPPQATIAVSQVAAEAPRNFGFDPLIVPNGIRIADFDTHRCSKLPTVVFIGRLNEPRKGFATLVAALPELRRLIPQVQVIAIGKGHTRIDGVIFTGQVSDRLRDSILASCDLLVAPHTHGESFGMVLVEALASGTQIVASDLPAFRDVVPTDQNLVRLVPPKDELLLARAITELLQNRNKVDRATAVKYAQRFDWDVIGPQIESVYESVLAIA